jgi:hypothetical protein
VRAALDAARVLAAGDPGSEPAAVLYAFASYRRAFPGAWKQMAVILAHGQATANGLRLNASGPELDALCADVMHQRVGFDRVRPWFALRLAPLAP